jgi:Hydrazine synthase alpha subunit middle domain
MRFIASAGCAFHYSAEIMGCATRSGKLPISTRGDALVPADTAFSPHDFHRRRGSEIAAVSTQQKESPKMVHTRTAVRVGVLGAGLILALDGCSGSQNSAPALPADVQAIIFLQRAPRDSGGNVFDYTSFVPGGRIVKLEPPAADGTLTNLTADPMFDNADFMSWDLSFDAKSIVFSAQLAGSGRYHLFTMNVDGTNVSQITEGDNDYVYPIFLPGQKVLFTTNRNVEAGTPQFADEYERATTAQVGTINLDGKNLELGPRNVSHRVAPALLPDGHVLFTEWRHLGGVNDGHLRMMNADMTGVREAFGSEIGTEEMAAAAMGTATEAEKAKLKAEQTASTNSYLRARYVGPSATGAGIQVIAIGTSRDRTLQAGRLLLADLGQSEATSHVTNLTRKVPGDRVPSSAGVGRYYDAEPVGSAPGAKFIVSWADGPVESEILALGKTNASFGLYVYDAASDARFPLYDDPNYWDVQARPIKARPEPQVTASPIQGTGFLVSALNVYNSSLIKIPAGTAVKVRLIEGFSGEEGIRTFGSTEFDGQSLYGEVPVLDDGSFAARVPANVPVHMQVLDKFGLSIANEPIWISGRAGEQRTCGGCHESRTGASDIPPGQIQAILRGAMNLDAPRAARIEPVNFTYGNVRGVPWDKAIQPILDAKCVSCHDGDASKPGPAPFTVTDMTTGTSQTFVFDLRGQKLDIMVGEKMTGDFTASYISIMGLGEILGEDVVTITGGMPFDFAQPADAAGSKVIEKLNPPQRFPNIDTSVRRFGANGRYAGKVHLIDKGGTDLTPDQYYLLGLSIDMGGQFFSRENKP